MTNHDPLGCGSSHIRTFRSDLQTKCTRSLPRQPKNPKDRRKGGVDPSVATSSRTTTSVYRKGPEKTKDFEELAPADATGSMPQRGSKANADSQ